VSPRARGLLACLLLLGACNFELQTGAGEFSCPDGTCPRGLECVAGLCRVPDQQDDGGGVRADADPGADAAWPPNCGDGVLQLEEGEDCDRGDGNNVIDGACLPSCKVARCGDGHVRLGVETCDPGTGSPGCTDRCLACNGDDRVELDGKCYVRNGGCGGPGTHGITITSAAENQIPEQLFDPATGTQDVSIHMLNQWQWLTYEPIGFTAWGPGEPAGQVLYNARIVTHPAGSPEAPYWKVGDSSEQLPYVCEQEGLWVSPKDGRAFAPAWGRVSHSGANDACRGASVLARLADLGWPPDPDLVAFLTPRIGTFNSYCIAGGGGYTCPTAYFGTSGLVIEELQTCNNTCVALCEVD
jgi:hypothetical protein